MRISITGLRVGKNPNITLIADEKISFPKVIQDWAEENHITIQTHNEQSVIALQDEKQNPNLLIKFIEFVSEKRFPADKLEAIDFVLDGKKGARYSQNLLKLNQNIASIFLNIVLNDCRALRSSVLYGRTTLDLKMTLKATVKKSFWSDSTKTFFWTSILFPPLLIVFAFYALYHWRSKKLAQNTLDQANDFYKQYDVFKKMVHSKDRKDEGYGKKDGFTKTEMNINNTSVQMLTARYPITGPSEGMKDYFLRKAEKELKLLPGSLKNTKVIYQPISRSDGSEGEEYGFHCTIAPSSKS